MNRLIVDLINDFRELLGSLSIEELLMNKELTRLTEIIFKSHKDFVYGG